jgi:hypothetical protein
MSGIVVRARNAFGAGLSGWAGRRELAALAGMAVGSAIDFVRLGPLGIVEICGDPNATLLIRLGAHRDSYAAMVAAIALVAFAELRAGAGREGKPLLLAAFHALAMCAGMAAGDLLAPGLPGRLTPEISLVMMTLGMALGAICAHALAGGGSRRAEDNFGVSGPV